MGEIKEIFEALSTRVRSPLFGYFFLALVAWNWAPIFYLFAANKSVEHRLEFFEAQTGAINLVGVPLLISIIAALSYPWIQLGFVKLTSRPVKLRNKANAETESDLLLAKIDLEKKRNELVRQREKQVLEEANINAELNRIGDEEAKTKARDEIYKIRKENSLGLPISKASLDRYLISKFPDLPLDPRIQELLLQDLDSEKYKTIEDIEEALNLSHDFLEYYEGKRPDLFKSSIDYVTKAIGWLDPEFRKKHRFSKDTLAAMEQYEQR